MTNNRPLAAAFLDMVLKSYDQPLPLEQLREVRNCFYAGAAVAATLAESEFIDMLKELQEFRNTLAKELSTEGNA